MHQRPTGSPAFFCLFVLLLGLTACLSACSALSSLKESPRISLADIRIQDIKAMEGIFLIKLRVQNPNEVDITLRGINCSLEIDGRHFASGVTKSDQTVPAYGTTVVPVTVYASLFDVVGSTLGLMHTAGSSKVVKKPLPYTVQGTIDISVKGFNKELPFTSNGELSLQGLMPLQ